MMAVYWVLFGELAEWPLWARLYLAAPTVAQAYVALVALTCPGRRWCLGVGLAELRRSPRPARPRPRPLKCPSPAPLALAAALARDPLRVPCGPGPRRGPALGQAGKQVSIIGASGVTDPAGRRQPGI